MARNEDPDLQLRWSSKLSLTARILAVNIFALAILAGSLFYLDSFRSRLTAARLEQARSEVRIIAAALEATPRTGQSALLRALGAEARTRLQLFGRDDAPVADSWAGAAPTFALRDPAAERWDKDIARLLDNGLDDIVGARRPPFLTVPVADRTLAAWPEANAARARRAPATMLRRAPDGTAFISAAAPVGGDGAVLLLTSNPRDIRAIVRDERLTLGIILLGAILLSVLLSLFLARTIARPLRRLARAAQRVRLGRAREVDVPRLPARRDEIGLLARALADMTQTLRHRIDATEAFAADVTHELKNPLASLRSAVDSLERVDDPALRSQLVDVIRHDVVRLDRLIVDIAEASRLDAELARARFEPVDLGAQIETQLPGWEDRAAARGVSIAFARPRVGSTIVMGESSRLGRAIDNIVDNAISFAAPGSLVELAATRIDEAVELIVEDEGPGVPEAARQAIFNRFHSIRPDGEAFGRHSGLGLAIAKAIVEGHDGAITAGDRRDGRQGARFVLSFPGVTP